MPGAEQTSLELVGTAAGFCSPRAQGLPARAHVSPPGGSPIRRVSHQEGLPHDGSQGCTAPPSRPWEPSLERISSPSEGFPASRRSHSSTDLRRKEGVKEAKCFFLHDPSWKTFFWNKYLQRAPLQQPCTTNSNCGTMALAFIRLQAPSRLSYPATCGRHFVVHPNVSTTFINTIKCRTWTQPTFTLFLETREEKYQCVHYRPGGSSDFIDR